MADLFGQLAASVTDGFGRLTESAIDAGVSRAETEIDEAISASGPVRKIIGPSTRQEAEAVRRDLANGDPTIIPSTGVSQRSPDAASGQRVSERSGLMKALAIGGAVIGSAFILPKLFGGK
jgi:hypothetical protein